MLVASLTLALIRTSQDTWLAVDTEGPPSLGSFHLVCEIFLLQPIRLTSLVNAYIDESPLERALPEQNITNPNAAFAHDWYGDAGDHPVPNGNGSKKRYGVAMILSISSCSLIPVPPDADGVELLEPDAPAQMEYAMEVPTGKRRLRIVNIIYGTPPSQKLRTDNDRCLQ